MGGLYSLQLRVMRRALAPLVVAVTAAIQLGRIDAFGIKVPPKGFVCASSPCEHGGTCAQVAAPSGHRKLQATAQFKCTCTPGYAPPLCAHYQGSLGQGTGSPKLVAIAVTPDRLLQRCEGDCNRDSDCAPGLKCFQRGSANGAHAAVPGCASGGSGDRGSWDYCIPPAALTPSPTPSPAAWAQAPNRQCSQRFAAKYRLRPAAEAACIAHGADCSGLYDYKCDAKGYWLLCKPGRLHSTSTRSCVYAKPAGAAATARTVAPAPAPVPHYSYSRLRPNITLLPLSTGAAALDGSPYGFYFARPATPSTKWTISIMGGGWCVTLQDCVHRARGSLGSSKSYIRKPSSCHCMNAGAKDVDPHSCNCIMLPYLDGASFSGYREKPWAVPGMAGKHLYFRGARNLDATLDYAFAHLGLRTATELVLTGGSAGTFFCTLPSRCPPAGLRLQFDNHIARGTLCRRGVDLLAHRPRRRAPGERGTKLPSRDCRARGGLLS